MRTQLINSPSQVAIALLCICFAASAGDARTPNENAGTFLCKTEQRAAIASDHREGSSGPIARVDDDKPTTFKMKIVKVGSGPQGFQLVELPYAGSDRDLADWGDEFTVLHSVYVGDGNTFRAKDSPSFFVFGSEPIYRKGEPSLEFYHSGFEYPGGEDTQLAVRWGRCKKAG